VGRLYSGGPDCSLAPPRARAKQQPLVRGLELEHCAEVRSERFSQGVERLARPSANVGVRKCVPRELADYPVRIELRAPDRAKPSE
jgi:hypothetical protein